MEDGHNAFSSHDFAWVLNCGVCGVNCCHILQEAPAEVSENWGEGQQQSPDSPSGEQPDSPSKGGSPKKEKKKDKKEKKPKKEKSPSPPPAQMEQVCLIFIAQYVCVCIRKS